MKSDFPSRIKGKFPSPPTSVTGEAGDGGRSFTRSFVMAGDPVLHARVVIVRYSGRRRRLYFFAIQSGRRIGESARIGFRAARRRKELEKSGHQAGLSPRTRAPADR